MCLALLDKLLVVLVVDLLGEDGSSYDFCYFLGFCWRGSVADFCGELGGGGCIYGLAVKCFQAGWGQGLLAAKCPFVGEELVLCLFLAFFLVGEKRIVNGTVPAKELVSEQNLVYAFLGLGNGLVLACLAQGAQGLHGRLGWIVNDELGGAFLAFSGGAACIL